MSPAPESFGLRQMARSLQGVHQDTEPAPHFDPCGREGLVAALWGAVGGWVRVGHGAGLL